MNYGDIKKLFDKFGAPLERDDVWSVQSATVIKHKALEKLAACASITFDNPQVLRAERDEAVILVTGQLGDRSEWSVGEALVNVNYRVTGKMAAYVYAMAEKRAKDRVILKLAGLQGLYSEDEADEFKDTSSAPTAGRNAPAAVSCTSGAGAPVSDEALFNTLRDAAAVADNSDDLREWWRSNLDMAKSRLAPDLFASLKDHVVSLAASLSQKEAA